MKRITLIGIFILFITVSTLTVFADMHVAQGETVTTCAYLKDGSVYQANKPAGIWGEAKDGTVVEAKLYNGETLVAESSAKAKSGRWNLTLPGQEGGYTPYTVEILVNGEEIKTYSNILFGAVWLASGQSNMQHKLFDTYKGTEYAKEADDAYLKIFQTTPIPGLGSTEAADIEGTWIMGDTATVGSVSAVAYHFALGLREELDVPVAILETSLGSTPIESWMSKEMIDTDEGLVATLKAHQIYQTEVKEFIDMGSMYYSKIAPLSNTSIAGVIWYQGETNAARANIYERELDIMKEAWGEDFGFKNDSMPFILAQLAPYSHEGVTNQMLLTEMMDAMHRFYNAHTETVGMVPIYDLSLQYQDTAAGSTQAVIHPTVKQPVGKRMALSALGLVYGKEEATAPTLADVQFTDGMAILTFEHVGEGLKHCDDAVDVLGFALGNENNAWVNATAKIVNRNTVVVYSHVMQQPSKVSYAYNDMNTDANLCASNGIPAAPFSTGGKVGIGARNYLNCDEDMFVVTGYATRDDQVGSAEYRMPWTFLNRSQVSFDSGYCAQGTASLKVTYERGEEDVIAGLDLAEANPYNTHTVGFGRSKVLAVKMSNGDKRDKEVRLAIGTSTSDLVFTKPQILKSHADFDTLVFDLTDLVKANGATAIDTNTIRNKATVIAFYINDTKAGTVWIDDLKMGVDEYWEPDVDETLVKLGVEKEPFSIDETKLIRDNSTVNLQIIIVIIIAIISALAVTLTVFVVRRKKRKNV